MLLMTEFLVITLFLLIFLSSKIVVEEYRINKVFYYIYLSVIVFLFSAGIPLLQSKAPLCYNDFLYAYLLDVVSCDFYFFFHFFFTDFQTVTFLIATVLGLMSIFFVAVFFILRHYQQKEISKKSVANVLRKQVVSRQALHTAPVFMFQK